MIKGLYEVEIVERKSALRAATKSIVARSLDEARKKGFDTFVNENRDEKGFDKTNFVADSVARIHNIDG